MGTTTNPTALPTALPTTSPSTTTTSTTSTTASTSTTSTTDDDDVDGSGSGSDDDSGSDEDDDAFFAGINNKGIDNGKDSLVGSSNVNGNDGNGEYDLDVSFSEMTYLNVWGIFALMLLLNGLCCFVCYKKKRMEQMRDIDDLNSANMEIVSE